VIFSFILSPARPFGFSPVRGPCSSRSRCSEAVVIEDMKKWIAVANPMIQAFVKYYAEKKLEF
jgi:hypothetical protein